MPDLIEYCVGNVDLESRERLRELDCRTVEKPCLQRCGACFADALLVVNGDVRRAETADDLLADLEGE